MKRKPILVTGGAGYIGSMVCKTLSKNGFYPIAFDNLFRGHKTLVKWGPLHVGDLTKIEDIEVAFQMYQPLAVIHMAALAYVVESINMPHMYYQNNVLGTLNLLEIMQKFKVENMIFSSTCSTYGAPLFTPIDETHPQNPLTPYGKSKYFMEQIIQDTCSHVIFRYFNAAGADLDTEVGEMHTPETHLIALALQTALRMHPHLYIYGNDFPTHDKTAVRDYIHVQDLATAHVLALQHLLEKGKNAILNLGTSKGSSILDVIQMVEKVTQKNVEYSFTQSREGEPAKLVACNDLAKNILGFTPQYSDLQTIVKSGYAWHKKMVHTLV